ncbi:YqjF family protein [Chryseolinea lacunae]|uniref:DUF2071 domain-containing protein n=1 Tax=Chryseolinea lacunae TaxID=2801331 RepID=A0ABS1KTK4_9BACT|nr:DUF2071 domain-containing protein [Chryseolinea lacunae]MBL0742770.1 DUF2071 domain-containing protein [Chryseolinea lacunae]
MSNTFLRAGWRKLVMANYAVDPAVLKDHVPYKTELDLWNNTCYVSLVGFMFVDTTVMGLKIPFHVNFEEVNLRFYVRCKDGHEWKRGVVFLKEIVPRAVLAWVANTVYRERYEALSMRHTWEASDENLRITYGWKKGTWHTLQVTTSSQGLAIAPGSEEEFITDHYWGYTQVGPEKTSEYRVEHPAWEVYKTKAYKIDVDFGKVYGEAFGFLSQQKPTSVFLAEGSAIAVNHGKRIT